MNEAVFSQIAMLVFLTGLIVWMGIIVWDLAKNPRPEDSAPSPCLRFWAQALWALLSKPCS